jgi:hypothetical protein
LNASSRLSFSAAGKFPLSAMSAMARANRQKVAIWGLMRAASNHDTIGKFS